MSIRIPSLDKHQFALYVGEDTKLGVDDVDRFIIQTQKVNGLSVRLCTDKQQQDNTTK